MTKFILGLIVGFALMWSFVHTAAGSSYLLPGPSASGIALGMSLAGFAVCCYFYFGPDHTFRRKR